MYRSNHTIFLAATMIVACAPVSEEIAPESFERSASGFSAVVDREAPLHWIHDENWRVAPQTGALERVVPCAEEETSLHPFAVEIGGDVAADGETILAFGLRIEPCPSRNGPDLPDNLPILAPRFLAHDGSLAANPGLVQQNPSTLAEYIAPHDLMVEIVGGVVADRTNHRTLVLVEPEYGPFARAGFRAVGLKVRVGVP